MMSLHDRLQISLKCDELEREGKPEESLALAKTIPMERWLAEWWKKYMGIDALRKSGWNLSEVEAECGHAWFDNKDYAKRYTAR